MSNPTSIPLHCQLNQIINNLTHLENESTKTLAYMQVSYQENNYTPLSQLAQLRNTQQQQLQNIIKKLTDIKKGVSQQQATIKLLQGKINEMEQLKHTAAQYSSHAECTSQQQSDTSITISSPTSFTSPPPAASTPIPPLTSCIPSPSTIENEFNDDLDETQIEIMCDISTNLIPDTLS